MTRTVTIVWNEPKNRWDMSHWSEAKKEWYFIMDFPPCENMLLFFRPRKGVVNKYNLSIEKVK